jgi:hypothetical protein
MKALTDALIAGLANGQTAYKLVGRYISSPLRWYVHKTSTLNESEDQGGHYRQRRNIPIGLGSQGNDVWDLEIGQRVSGYGQCARHE